MDSLLEAFRANLLATRKADELVFSVGAVDRTSQVVGALDPLSVLRLPKANSDRSESSHHKVEKRPTRHEHHDEQNAFNYDRDHMCGSLRIL
ncbi:MAG: hypothetical protein M3081_15155 [Gemmatimonadota bacterium]|nr:hypothetical protein [Gemmatimonadota bacterium]